MLTRIVRGALALIGVGVLAAGVFALRDATMSVHSRQHPDSRLEVVLEAELRGSEAGQTLEEYTWAKVLSCRTEIGRSDPVGPLEALPDADETRFRLVLQPSLDDTDRKQFRGCMEDWTIDHLEVGVDSMTELPFER